MHQSRNPQRAIHNRNVPLVHTSNNTNGALWDTGPVHRGIRREVHCAKLPAVRAKIMLLSLVEFLREAHTFCWSQIIHRNYCTSRLSKLPEHIHNVYRHFVLNMPKCIHGKQMLTGSERRISLCCSLRPTWQHLTQVSNNRKSQM